MNAIFCPRCTQAQYIFRKAPASLWKRYEVDWLRQRWRSGTRYGRWDGKGPLSKIVHAAYPSLPIPPENSVLWFLLFMEQHWGIEKRRRIQMLRKCRVF